MPRLLLLHKPYNVLCQFSDAAGRATLGDYVPVPGVYPAGRLDRDSEGLVLLTDDGRLQARLSQPCFKLPKTYWVQVEGVITDAALAAWVRGVPLDGRLTLPAQACRMAPPAVPERQPPIRYRKSIPTSWLQLTLTEGRNRQVRRMTAAVGFPTLRLIRASIGPLSLAGLEPGRYRDALIPEREALENFFSKSGGRKGRRAHEQQNPQRTQGQTRRPARATARGHAQPSPERRVSGGPKKHG